MEEKIFNKLEEMNKNFVEKLEIMDQKLAEMDQKFQQMQKEISQIRNQQLIFEYEYGTKIDAIFDSVSLELDKNLEKSQKIRSLENRMDRTEVEIFGHEKRISKLELNQ